MPLVIGEILVALAYSFAMGRGFPLVVVAVGLLVLDGLLSLWRSGELA